MDVDDLGEMESQIYQCHEILYYRLIVFSYYAINNDNN